ncbi:anti-sigma F factor antagonist [Lactobacillus kefiranofaciens]|nr:Anti-sigma F factor antagonist [Lactobacillus kefiranofaciens subsp. kefiranofaciens]PAK97488.1 anti-sigma F factor antagonist [Lactobacillus kefiranofaciens]QFQ68797.1 anti-sigma F factor antagonist [Lactobacillus kefiranofaciens subsp. kefiranofaciens]
MHIYPFREKEKTFKSLLDPKKQILKAFIVIKTQPLNNVFS